MPHLVRNYEDIGSNLSQIITKYHTYLVLILANFSAFMNSSRLVGGLVTGSSTFFSSSGCSSLAIRAATLGSMSGLAIIVLHLWLCLKENEDELSRYQESMIDGDWRGLMFPC